ncbi:MAG TPA: NUDIX domain-containing protein [Gemmatimonadaceae bacterium]|nr:NUDIX domain-containing protein [Gemmatimonadaceae bacterium]
MPERASSSGRVSSRRPALSVDVVSLTPHGRHLTALLVRAGDSRSKERWELPHDAPRADETIDDAAARVERAALGVQPAMIEQIAAFGDRRRHPSDAVVSIGYVALVSSGASTSPDRDAAWFSVDELPPIAPRQRAIVEGAMHAVRARLDQSPIAFRLLPPTFTLSQLQEIYELLLGRRLHKASFRRALHASWLVEPTDEWRSEGRGRPAQLFRYAPRKRRGSRRGVRFEGVSGSLGG